MEFDSKEELYFSWWLDELKDKGYVLEYQRCKPYVLSHPIDKHVLGKKLEGHEYTPDFVVKWACKAFKVFYGGDSPTIITDGNYESVLDGDNESIIEIKPSFDANNMTRLFRLNQKWMYDAFNIYVNLIVPEKLFSKTFCPDRFRYTDGGKSMRKLNKQYLTLDEYIHRTREEKPKRTNRKGVQGNSKG